jgi:hypothetical protein
MPQIPDDQTSPYPSIATLAEVPVAASVGTPKGTRSDSTSPATTTTRSVHQRFGDRGSSDDAGPLLPMKHVLDRYKVSDKTIERWLASETLGFPRPIYINKRRYFYERELIEFERSRVAASPT